ncbi:hypothetical protein KWH75_20215 [Morganella morganii]|uniref:hypothetical protein n=1 Tax=Morganella morganii TaxID=582 RepID=UPI0021CF0C4C|nr:hypothetical protein [Morganella morganii]MCU6239390.1 hypothetical protein [Morganella morganii]
MGNEFIELSQQQQGELNDLISKIAENNGYSMKKVKNFSLFIELTPEETAGIALEAHKESASLTYVSTMGAGEVCRACNGSGRR